jgi:hypothetical protein
MAPEGSVLCSQETDNGQSINCNDDYASVNKDAYENL